METENVEIIHDHTKVVMHKSHSCPQDSHDENTITPESTSDSVTQLSKMQALFDKTVCEGLDLPYKYAKVNALLIRWEDYLDPESDCEQEVNQLKDVFETKFNFPTQVLVLDDQKSPQVQLTAKISSFILENDGPCQTSLMIVYYTGHGRQLADGLEIAGEREPGTKSLGVFEATAHWNKAQQLFRDDTKADILVILDTCFAGNAMKGLANDPRSFETLTASTDKLPTAAGNRSFSKALIAALKEKANDPKQMPFNAFDLNARIMEKRGIQTSQVFRESQGVSHRWIKLAPLDKSVAPVSSCSSTKAASQITVRFTLKEIKTLNEDVTTKLATVVSEAARQSDLSINKIELVGHTEIEDDHPKTKKGNTLEPFRLLMLILKVQRKWRRYIMKKRLGQLVGGHAESTKRKAKDESADQESKRLKATEMDANNPLTPAPSAFSNTSSPRPE